MDFQAEMVLTLVFAMERSPSDTRGCGNVQKVTSCTENR